MFERLLATLEDAWKDAELWQSRVIEPPELTSDDDAPHVLCVLWPHGLCELRATGNVKTKLIEVEPGATDAEIEEAIDRAWYGDRMLALPAAVKQIGGSINCTPEQRAATKAEIQVLRALHAATNNARM